MPLPKLTACTPVNPLPEIVTEVPPALVPDGGEMPVTIGAAVGVVVAAVTADVTVMVCVNVLLLLPAALLSVNDTV